MIKKPRKDDIVIERINEQNQKPRRGDIIMDQENKKSRRDDIVIEQEINKTKTTKGVILL